MAGPSTPRGCCHCPALPTCRCGLGAEHRVRRRWCWAGLQQRPVALSGGAAEPVARCLSASLLHMHFSREAALAGIELLQYKLGCPIHLPSLFLLLPWNHVCKGRWMGKDSYEPGTVSLLQNQRTGSFVAVDGGLHWVGAGTITLKRSDLGPVTKLLPVASVSTPVKWGGSKQLLHRDAARIKHKLLSRIPGLLEAPKDTE